MSNTSNNVNVTVSIPWMTLLTVMFIVLKLTNLIAWSWWWVFSPIWIPVAIVGVLFSVILLIALLANM